MITKREFGKTPKGDNATLYTIQNGSMSVGVCDYGARIVFIKVPDKLGNTVDVALGFDCCEEYSKDIYIGATIGRVAGRIANGEFTLNGKKYYLARNNGGNNLHGGIEGFHAKLFSAEYTHSGNSLKMSLVSPDMDEGFPGEVRLSVSFTVTDDNTLRIEYEARSNADTIVNFTNHAYFNLDGALSGETVENHSLCLSSDAYLAADKSALATGEIVPVENTTMDFSSKKRVGEALGDTECEAIAALGGLDHSFVLDNAYGNFKSVAEIRSDKTGIAMETVTDCPAVQIYTALHFGDFNGKDNVKYPRFGGICFETQNYPNAVNYPHFPSPVLRCGEVFKSKTEYRFKVI